MTSVPLKFHSQRLPYMWAVRQRAIKKIAIYKACVTELSMFKGSLKKKVALSNTEELLIFVSENVQVQKDPSRHPVKAWEPWLQYFSCSPKHRLMQAVLALLCTPVMYSCRRRRKKKSLNAWRKEVMFRVSWNWHYIMCDTRNMLHYLEYCTTFSRSFSETHSQLIPWTLTGRITITHRSLKASSFSVCT